MTAEAGGRCRVDCAVSSEMVTRSEQKEYKVFMIDEQAVLLLSH